MITINYLQSCSYFFIFFIPLYVLQERCINDVNAKHKILLEIRKHGRAIEYLYIYCIFLLKSRDLKKT